LFCVLITKTSRYFATFESDSNEAKIQDARVERGEESVRRSLNWREEAKRDRRGVGFFVESTIILL
jgi:hypothetical protein